jgi:methionyl aminopeptidase
MKLKTKEDIEILREGGKRHAEILHALAQMVHPGITTLELEEEAGRLIAECGDASATLGYTPSHHKRPYPAMLCVSINNEIVHGIPNEKPKVINAGDIVAIDLSLIHKKRFTDAAITVAVGKADEESEMLISATKEALRRGIEAARPGNHIGDIGAAIYASAKKSGFSIAEDLAGHGVGFKLHEDPYVPNFGEKGEGEKLVPGLVIAIEPMLCAGSGSIRVLPDGYTIVTRDGKKSAHFEHTVAITETGNIVLTE